MDSQLNNSPVAGEASLPADGTRARSPFWARRAAPRDGLFIYLAIVFAVMLGTGMTFPLLALAADHFGGGAAEAGYLLAAFGASRLITNFPAGYAADRFGHRVTLLVGLAIVAVASFGAWNAGSVDVLVICVFLQGGGSAACTTAILALFSERSVPTNRGLMMSRYQSAALIGIAIGPLAGGLLSSRFGMMTPFAVVGLLAIAGIVFLAFITGRRNKDATAQNEALSDATEGQGAARGPKAVFIAICVVLFAMFLTRTATNWQLVPIVVRDSFGVGPEMIGLLLSSGAFVNLLVQRLSGRLIDGWGAARSIVLGAGGIVAALAVLSVGGALWVVWVGVIMLGFFCGIAGPALNAMAIAHPLGGYGRTMGTLRTAGDAGLVLGPLLLGQFLDEAGLSYRHGLLTATAIMAMSLCAFVIVCAMKANKTARI